MVAALSALTACQFPEFDFHDKAQPDADALVDAGMDEDDASIEASDDAADAVADRWEAGDAREAGCASMPDDCPAGQYCSASQVCRTGCKNTMDCVNSLDAAVFTCDPMRRKCVGCTSDNDCPLGTICNAATECVPGCTVDHGCASGQDCCSGACFDLQFDLQHCGACDHACDPNPVNATPSCFQGACRIACAPFTQDCDHDILTGCEADIRSDPLNCNICGHVCPMETACIDRTCF